MPVQAPLPLCSHCRLQSAPLTLLPLLACCAPQAGLASPALGVQSRLPGARPCKTGLRKEGVGAGNLESLVLAASGDANPWGTELLLCLALGWGTS